MPMSDQVSVCLPPVEPVLADIISRPVLVEGYDWYDPIVVDETAGWIISTPSVAPATQMSEGREGLGQACGYKTPIGSQTKKPRGRPKKSQQQQPTDDHMPTISKCCLETLETWNTAKLLGISATQDSAVLSGIRKSKRLMILEGKDIGIE